MKPVASYADLSGFAESKANSHTLTLVVEGMRCAACAWQIESELNRLDQVQARVNLSTNRLVLQWQGSVDEGNALVAKAAALGFNFMPFEGDGRTQEDKKEEKYLLKCIAVAAFASGNIMLFSFALWTTSQAEMGIATRDLMQWASAIIALPAIIYSGRPYFYSAFNALSHLRTNMDVPISMAVLLATSMSLLETIRQGEYVYFDSSTMLLTLLLVGRYLDKKARGKARAAAQDMLAMLQGTATIVEKDTLRILPIRDLRPDMELLVAAGERIAADGIIITGVSEVDPSLITGETIPIAAKANDTLFAGMVNISAPLTLRVVAASQDSLLADIVKLMENSEQGQAKYVRVADKVAGYYTPVVHLLALVSFIGWLCAGLVWQQALMIATTVLIITCPCALGLAVPVVQVVASGRLFRQGMMLKSGDALERLATINTIVFDKTGTLTLGKPMLANEPSIARTHLQLAASLAAKSQHPLARALSESWKKDILPLEVIEEPGHGLRSFYAGKALRLGSRSWCGDTYAAPDDALEMWLNREGEAPIRFIFKDSLRLDAKETVEKLQKKYTVILLSGDRESVACSIANALGIKDYAAGVTPAGKSERITQLIAQGHKVLMVGDGLNDAPSLAAATVSMSPSSAIDITQNAADIVFQGEKLAPIVTAITIAVASQKLVKQNFALSFFYNILSIPLAVTGQVTPLMAALAMSASSLMVILNALRLNKTR